MKREKFISWLLDNGCLVIRNANSGYTIIRNVINGKISGVPVNDPLKPATICRICLTLEINKVPEEAKAAEEIIAFAHKAHRST